ncbi:MAG: CARDB domain-containing protein [Candidatus Bathyarchaeota archaeon]|nr:hypothetical protein [Candidatus Bathyarchaeota archaeon A05DMB-5]MDH7557893.1 CARDB domain-containing protein [Candidatus Bathyarchaeota archaeon]
MKTKIYCATLILLMLAATIVLNSTTQKTDASPTPEYSFINPGPASWPTSWTAGPPRYIDTSDFIFYSNETDVDDTFFMNVTVTNAERMKGWGIGIVFDHTKLAYNGSRRPPDHIFQPVQDMGWTIIAPSPTIESINGTHTIIKWGCTYIMGEPEWTFNGTGTLCQIRFRIIKGVSETSPKVVAWFAFDPEWTALYQHPAGTIIPSLGSGYYQYLYPIVPKIAHLTFEPERVVDVSLVPTSSFNMSLKVFNATDLYSWEVKIYYKNQILNATNVFEGDFLKSIGTTAFAFDILSNYNATHGQISISCYLVGAENGGFGDGELAKITFEVLDFGDTPITIADDNLYDSFDLPIAHTKGSGYFSNILIAKLSIDPSEVIDPSLVPCTNFTINVTVADIENMKMVIFNLTYTREVLLELQVNIPSVQGQMPTKKISIDDESGYIWVNLTYPNPITTYTPVTIATITFHVEAMGVSPINLTDTHIEDPTRKPIVHEVYHGMFIGLIRDVAVVKIEVYPNVAYAGWLVYVNVTVRNNGNLTETFNVRGKYDSTMFNQTTVADLPPHTETTVTLVWDTKGVTPCHNYTISAEAETVPFEMNLSDNILADGTVKIKIMGDINGDGRVSMDDINVIVTAFGTYPGHPRWTPDADLDQNGRITMGDIILVVMSFGKTC